MEVDFEELLRVEALPLQQMLHVCSSVSLSGENVVFI